MALARLKDWAYPERIKDMDDVDTYLRRHYQQHVEESQSRVEDFESLEINTLTVTDWTIITSFNPSVDNVVDLAATTLRFKDIYLAGSLKDDTVTLTVANAKDAYDKRVTTWGNGLEYSSQTAAVDYNTTNLKITSNELDTIQSIATGASPSFAALGLGTGELTAGSINRGSGTLTLEIGGTPIESLTSTGSAITGDITATDNLGVGITSWGTSAVKVLGIGGSTAPSTSPADMIQLWSADRSAGFAQAYYRAEGGVARVLDSRFNVKDYGATGDGSTDDTSAIQAAIDAATVGDIIFFPQAIYKVVSTLSISTNRITFQGEGSGSAIHFYPTGATDNLFEADGSTDSVAFKEMTLYLKDFEKEGDTNSNTTVDNMDNTTGLFNGMFVTGTDIPANTTIASVDSSTQITISQSATGSTADVTLTFKVSSTTCCELVAYDNQYIFDRVYFEGWTEYCINADSIEYTKVKKCRFLNIGHTANNLGIGIRTTTYANVVDIESNRFSDCDKPISMNTSGAAVNFVNNSVESSSISAESTAIDNLYFEGAKGLRIEGNYFEGNLTGANTGVIRCDSCRATTIKANYFAGQDAGNNDKSDYFISAVSCPEMEISNNEFNEIITGFVLATGNTVNLRNNYYYDAGGQITAIANIEALLTGTYIIHTSSFSKLTGSLSAVGDITTGGALHTAQQTVSDTSRVILRATSQTATGYLDFNLLDTAIVVPENTGYFRVTEVTSNNELMRVQANGIIKLGDIATNYAQFAADGELTLAGTARVTKTADIDIGRVKLPGVNQPGEGTEDNFSTLDFNKASDEEVYLHWHIPYAYADAGNIDVHFYFFADAQPGSDEVVRWGVEYKKLSIGDVFDFDAGTSGATTGTTVANADPAKTIYSTGNMSLTTTGFVGGDHILFRFYRDADGTSGTDDLNQDARMFRIHLEYLMNKLGKATT